MNTANKLQNTKSENELNLSQSNHWDTSSRSTSFLTDLSSYFNGNNSSNFLVKVDSLPYDERIDSRPTTDILQDRRNVKLQDQISEEQPVEYRKLTTEDGNKLFSADKENMQINDVFVLSDLLNKPLYPPVAISGSKISVKPTLPSILERSCEDGKALSIASFSRSSSASTISDKREYATKLKVQKQYESKYSSENVGVNVSDSKTACTKRKIDVTNYRTDSPTTSNIACTSMSSSYLDAFGSSSVEDFHADGQGSWDKFDKVMESSFAAEPFPRLKEVSVAQQNLGFDDGEFRSFTAEEATDFMDRDEAERLQFITSQNETVGGNFSNGPGSGAFDNNMSMGAYFIERSCTPFVNKQPSFPDYSKIFRERSSNSVQCNDDIDDVCTTAQSEDQMNESVRLSESFQSMYEDEKIELKLPDTSLDTLGKFFMGPESKYLAGNHKGMMEYVIEYCKKKAERTIPLEEEEQGATDKHYEKEKYVSSRSSGSSGISSFVSNNTVLSKVGVSKAGRYDFHNEALDDLGGSDEQGTDEQSIVIAGHGTISQISESILGNTMDNTHMYAKFKEDLMQSRVNGFAVSGASRSNSVRQQRLGSDSNLTGNKLMPIRDRFVPDDVRLVTSTNHRQMSLELLRKDSQSPPERLSTKSNLRKVSFSDSWSDRVHSTPLQQESLSSSLAKQLGLGNMMSVDNLASMGNTTMESRYNDVQKRDVAEEEYNYLANDKITKTVVNKQDSNNLGTNSVVLKVEPSNQHTNDFEIGSSVELERFNSISTGRRAPKTNPHANQPSTSIVRRPSKIESSVQTSFLQTVTNTAITAPSANPVQHFGNQCYNSNQVPQAQGFGFPVIIQIHCQCSGGVSVLSSQSHSQSHSSAFVPTGSDKHQSFVTQSQPDIQPSRTYSDANQLKATFADAEENVVTKLIPRLEEQTACIEVDKIHLEWGFVDFGKTEMNTVCLSNKQNVQFRFKATIVENSYVKNFKFVLDPADPRIKETERTGILPPLGSKQLKVNFSPVKGEGSLRASIHLRLHTDPYTDFGFKSEIPLIVRDRQTTKSKRAISPNSIRAGDQIKIQNTNMKFGKVAVKSSSHKVVTITNNGSSSAKFLVSSANGTLASENGKAIVTPFTISAVDGAIAKGSTKEIIFTYRPLSCGKHSQHWRLDVTFVHDCTQMTKSTTITLEGDGLKLT